METSRSELAGLDAWWRAANYLAVGQIYLQENPLLREPLRPEHVKPRLLGYWGAAPGLNLIYAHLNRLIRLYDANLICLVGPGHGAPAVLANVYLEGTYSEIYPAVSQDAAGMRQLFRQFATPGGSPSHVGPATPGSIHAGGKRGDVLAHAFGAAFDNPELVVVAVIGGGEAEMGPLQGSWKGASYLNPVRDGAVLPVLHLDGRQSAGPSPFARTTDENVRRLLVAQGYAPRFVEGDDPDAVHEALASVLAACLDDIQLILLEARARGQVQQRPHWPALVLRTPQGWTGPRLVDGVPVEGTWRAHQLPLGEVRTSSEHLAQLEAWLRSYRPEELFDAGGRLVPELAALAPQGTRRMSANPHANGGCLSPPLELPSCDAYGLTLPGPGRLRQMSTLPLGEMLRDIYVRNPHGFRLFCPDDLQSNRLGAVFEVERCCLVLPGSGEGDTASPEGRVMEVPSEHDCQGWLEGYLLSGRHGLLAMSEASAALVASMTTQHGRWLERSGELCWRAPVPSLNLLCTSTWQNDAGGLGAAGPGFMDGLLSKKSSLSHVYLPPDANCLLCVAHHCLRTRDSVNLMVIDRQPQLQWLGFDAARLHCARGASIWSWLSSAGNAAPDVVLACAGDSATLEAVAAAAWLRDHAPELRVRVVNVVDLMGLRLPSSHPHGLPEQRFAELFTEDCPVIFAVHGQPGTLHTLLHGRPGPGRFHVHGYAEEGSAATTAFERLVSNRISRFHLAIAALEHARRAPPRAHRLLDTCFGLLERQREYVSQHFEDLPEIRDWVWSEAPAMSSRLAV